MDNTKLSTEFQKLDVDYLYHLGLDTTMDLKAQFGGIKHVVFTRSFASSDQISNLLTSEFYGINDIKIHCEVIAKDERYHLHKVAHTLVVSHGVGFPSMLICLNEITKLLFHAGATDFNFYRVGPAGGVGISEDNVIIASEALSPELKPEWKNIEFGEYYSYSTQMKADLTNKLIYANKDNGSIINGKVLSSANFYEGQARLNGAIAPSFNKVQRDAYLQQAHEAGVRAIDMESACFTAFCKNMDIPATMILPIIVDRLCDNDQEPVITADQTRVSPIMVTASKILSNLLITTL